MTTLHRSLVWASIVLACAAVYAAFFSILVCGILAALSGFAAVWAGLIDWLGDDDPYDTTVFGDPYVNVIQFPSRVTSEVVHTPLHAITVIEGGKTPVWRDELRPTWPTDIGGVE